MQIFTENNKNQLTYTKVLGFGKAIFLYGMSFTETHNWLIKVHDWWLEQLEINSDQDSD